jgi:hypothetical protein
MTTTTFKTTTGRDLDTVADQLAQALGNLRFTLAGWPDIVVIDAIKRLDASAPLIPDDPDRCDAERILRHSLKLAYAERLARSAPQIDTDVIEKDGRWSISVQADRAYVFDRSFGSFPEAKAAADTLRGFLEMAGRSGKHGESADYWPTGALPEYGQKAKDFNDAGFLFD